MNFQENILKRGYRHVSVYEFQVAGNYYRRAMRDYYNAKADEIESGKNPNYERADKYRKLASEYTRVNRKGNFATQRKRMGRPVLAGLYGDIWERMDAFYFEAGEDFSFAHDITAGSKQGDYKAGGKEVQYKAKYGNKIGNAPIFEDNFQNRAEDYFAFGNIGYSGSGYWDALPITMYFNTDEVKRMGEESGIFKYVRINGTESYEWRPMNLQYQNVKKAINILQNDPNFSQFKDRYSEMLTNLDYAYEQAKDMPNWTYLPKLNLEKDLWK